MGLESPPQTAPHAPVTAPLPVLTAQTVSTTVVSTPVSTIRPLGSPRPVWRPKRVTQGDDPVRTWAWNAALWATFAALRTHETARLVQAAGQVSLACSLLDQARGRARYALRKLDEFRLLSLRPVTSSALAAL